MPKLNFPRLRRGLPDYPPGQTIRTGVVQAGFGGQVNLLIAHFGSVQGG